jgi:3'-5' exoribonuclease
MRRFFLIDAQSGDSIDDVYVLCNKQLAATNTNKLYIKGLLGDRSNQLPARLWNASRELFSRLPDNGFVRVRGHVENYQSNLQIVVEEFLRPADQSYDIADLLPHTEKDIPQMSAALRQQLGTIRNRALSALIQAYLDDAELMSNFSRAPAAMSHHHAYIGGLLEHTLNAMQVADAMCPFYPTLNRDLVIAGIFLHDIAKTWELVYETSFSYSDGGQLVGHIVKSAIWLEHKRAIAELALKAPIPQDMIDVLQHIIISHHGQPEFGAVKVPGTPEAIAVHHIENMDAKLTTALAATRGAAPIGCEGNWTEYLKMAGTRLYRRDVAPADDVAAPSPAASPAEPEPASQPPAPPRNGPAAMKITNPLFDSSGVKPKH